jgi:hypothetical protein
MAHLAGIDARESDIRFQDGNALASETMPLTSSKSSVLLDSVIAVQ